MTAARHLYDIMANFSSPHALLIEQLQEIYGAENQVIDALPLMGMAPADATLKSAFETCLKQTAERAELVADLLRELQERPEAKTCRGIAGLIVEARETIAARGESGVRDFALLIVARKIEHFHLVSYDCAQKLADHIGENAIAEALRLTRAQGANTEEWLAALIERIDLAPPVAYSRERK